MVFLVLIVIEGETAQQIFPASLGPGGGEEKPESETENCENLRRGPTIIFDIKKNIATFPHKHFLNDGIKDQSWSVPRFITVYLGQKSPVQSETKEETAIYLCFRRSQQQSGPSS